MNQTAPIYGCDVLGQASERERMENTALRHVPVRRVFHLDGAPCHFSSRVSAFLDREFPDRCIARGGPIPWRLVLQI
jgi:hypothetical protein